MTKDYKAFCEWVASEIFDDLWEYNKDAFEELACRKLHELGIVKKEDNKWVYEYEEKTQYH